MYQTIAKYYDLLGWAEFHDVAWPRLQPLLDEHNCQSYLDLACGTGTLAFTVAKTGREVVGIDISAQMLAVAENSLRRFTVNPKPLFLKRDMTHFNLSRTFDAVGCFFDAANHVLDEERFAGICNSAFRHLRPGGFFMFDVNTPVGMHKWDAVLFSKKGEHALIMKGKYNRSTRLAEVMISGFVMLGPGKRDEFRETFFERAYRHTDIIRFLRRAGFGRIIARPTKAGRTLRNAHRVFYTAFKPGDEA
jgi:SAM-dependent methyltransferase